MVSIEIGIHNKSGIFLLQGVSTDVIEFCRAGTPMEPRKLTKQTNGSENRLKWTARGIEALRVPTRQDFTDPETKGLTLRASSSGSKSWALLYRRRGDGRKRRATLGEFPAMSLADARAKAATLKVAIQNGADPAGAVAEYKKADTVNQLLDSFIAKHPRPDAAWTKEVKRVFQKDVYPAIGRVKLPDLSRAHVRLVLERVRDRGATVTVNRTLAALRRAFSWAVSQDLLTINPALNMCTDIEETSRDRALSIGEVTDFWRGLGCAAMAERTKIALRLVLVTGQRPGEVCGARRAEIDLDRAEWLIPAKRAKNRRPHTVPLSALALQLFTEAIGLSGGSEYVFPSRPRLGRGSVKAKPLEAHGLSHAMRKELRSLGLGGCPATPHDLRRTVATHMARIGVADVIVGRVLNHGSELRRTITSKVYIHHDYLAEKRRALEAWAKELVEIVDEKPLSSNVVRLEAKP